MDKTTINHGLSRKEASHYIAERWGFHQAVSTLAHLASVGGGPCYRNVGRYVFYPEAELDKWAQSRISPLKEKASEVAK